MKEQNFGYLGYNFQVSLLSLLIEDKRFATNILDVINPKYFDNQYFKMIAQMIKEHHEKYETTPSYDALEQIANGEYTNTVGLKAVLDMLKTVREHEVKDPLFTQDKTTQFCKQQEMSKAVTEVKNILDKGNFEQYQKAEGLIREALAVGEKDTGTEDIFDNLSSVLEEDYRHPIPMGIDGIDNLLNGGLAKGELGVVLAPTGVGKTTMLTKIANSAYNLGYNVLQIFFEDNPKVIRRKHITCWTGISDDEMSERKEEVMTAVEQRKASMGNTLTLKKLASDTYTLPQIKNQIRKIIADGTKIDLIVLDYIDCVSPEKSFSGDEWKSEGSVMRQFEAMCYEFDVAAWTATQGNRSSISSDVVTTDQMGGSIKKAQVGHVIISLAKSLQQKELGLATIAITKSRLGQDGIIFENCTFDNKMLEISTEQTTTFLGLEEDKAERRRERLKSAQQIGKTLGETGQGIN
jgi:replicative DNA helicase